MLNAFMSHCITSKTQCYDQKLRKPNHQKQCAKLLCPSSDSQCYASFFALHCAQWWRRRSRRRKQQPTNPPIHQPTNPPTHQPTNPPTHQPANPPTRQPTNPPTHQPTNPPTNPPTHQPTNPPTHQPTNPPTHQPTNPPNNQATKTTKKTAQQTQQTMQQTQARTQQRSKAPPPPPPLGVTVHHPSNEGRTRKQTHTTPPSHSQPTNQRTNQTNQTSQQTKSKQASKRHAQRPGDRRPNQPATLPAPSAIRRATAEHGRGIQIIELPRRRGVHRTDLENQNGNLKVHLRLMSVTSHPTPLQQMSAFPRCTVCPPPASFEYIAFW